MDRDAARAHGLFEACASLPRPDAEAEIAAALRAERAETIERCAKVADTINAELHREADIMAEWIRELGDK